MSDRGRPQFLPPEEPEEPPAPQPAGPPAPPAGRDARGRIIAVAGAAAIVTVAFAAIILHGAGDRTPPPALPSILPSVASPPAQPGFATPPDLCALPRDVLPADVRSVKPKQVADSCAWEILRPDRSRNLDVSVTLQMDGPAPGAGTAAAERAFAEDLAYAADPARNGGFQSDPERLGGLGDEAFAARSYNLVVAGRTERTARQYDMGGAMVEVRLRNAVVTVKWRGADYPPSARDEKKLVGAKLPYENARRDAVAVAQAVLARLR